MAPESRTASTGAAARSIKENPQRMMPLLALLPLTARRDLFAFSSIPYISMGMGLADGFPGRAGVGLAKKLVIHYMYTWL
jgi:hypothetical protein